MSKPEDVITGSSYQGNSDPLLRARTEAVRRSSNMEAT